MYNKLRQVWPLALSATIGFVIALALVAPKAYSSNQNVYRIIKERINVLNQIIGYVNHFYFDAVDMEKVMDGAFHGLMEELDPHSTYIPAKDQENISELFKGNFQGIGIEFDILDGFITVISPIPDSPSDIVGLMPGDKIIAINGEDAYKITKTEVFEKLRGRKGTEVNVTIGRIGLSKPFDVTIIRDNIPIYSVGAATMIDEKTGYIFLRRFSATTEKEVVKAIDTLLSQGMERLLFDLRGNSGGLLEQAAAISNQFITTADTLVYTQGKIKESNQVFIGNPAKGNKSSWSAKRSILLITSATAPPCLDAATKASSSSSVHRMRSHSNKVTSTSVIADNAALFIRRFMALDCPLCNPGVSIKISWMPSSVLTPKICWRVVCGLREVMLSFCPSR